MLFIAAYGLSMANDGIVECVGINLNFFNSFKVTASFSGGGTDIEIVDDVACLNSVKIAIAVFFAGNKTTS